LVIHQVKLKFIILHFLPVKYSNFIKNPFVEFEVLWICDKKFRTTKRQKLMRSIRLDRSRVYLDADDIVKFQDPINLLSGVYLRIRVHQNSGLCLPEQFPFWLQRRIFLTQMFDNALRGLVNFKHFLVMAFALACFSGAYEFHHSRENLIFFTCFLIFKKMNEFFQK